ncbi:DUF1570 domain-containing protein [Rubripirellula amarantea]|nr:DUF1570 domain-containing protein [Rubripirellula amarantea]
MPLSVQTVIVAIGLLFVLGQPTVIVASQPTRGDRVLCFIPQSVEGETDTAPATPLPSYATPDELLASFPHAGKGSAWHRYMMLWRSHYHAPDDKDIRRYFGFATNDRDPNQNYRLDIRRGRSAPAELKWKRGSYAEIQSNHFVIYSRGDRETSTQVAETLEQCYWVWTQLCFPFWEAAPQVSSHFDAFPGSELASPDNEQSITDYLRTINKRVTTKKRMKVVLFRDATEYAQSLRVDIPGIERSTGFYNDERKITFLFAPKLSANDPGNSDEVLATLRHEVVHQLFREATTNKSAHSPGKDQDFWLVEGIAGYFESMVSINGCVTLGGWDSPRLQFARYRILASGDRMPMAELRRDSRETAQMRTDLPRWYAHAIANTHRLLDGGDQDTRQWIYDQLATLYQLRTDFAEPRAEASPLVDDPDAMQSFLSVDDDHLIRNPSQRSLRQICFAGCEITSSGLRTLERLDHLQWLDLSRSKIDSAAVMRLAPRPAELEQLSLEATQIDDAVASWLTKLNNLHELDLSWTRIGDETVRAINDDAPIETLWLTGSKVTDDSIEKIAKMKRLESVDVQRTSVSHQGLTRLKELRPRLAINPLELREPQ